MSEPSPSKEELDRLLMAAEDGNISDLHYLLEDKKWDVNTRGPGGDPWYNGTLLLITARHAQLEAFKLLLTKGADIHAKDTYDYAALHCAAAGGDSTIVKELIKSGLDVNAIDGGQVTPLHVAALNGHHEVFQLLLTAGAKLDMVDKDNSTTLHHAAIGGVTAIVKECIKSGLDVNAIDKSGNTPLHEASYQGNIEAVKELVNSGANVTMINKLGRTPFENAVRYNESGVVWWFVKQHQTDTSQFDEDTQQKIKELVEQEEARQAESQEGTFTAMGRGRITKKTIYAYKQAMRKGTRASNQLKLVMIGPEGAGKTSTVGSLLDKQFQQDQESTVGASLNTCTVERIFASEWRQSEIKDQLENLPKKFKSRMKICVAKVSKNVDDRKVTTSSRQGEIPKEVLSRVQEVVDAKEVSDGDIRVIILDLGGQEIYYEIHFMFLAPEDVVLMTFDASKGLDQPVISRQRLDRFQKKVAARGMQTNLEILETLFQSVYSHCGVEAEGDLYISKRIPTILMIATHAKGLTDQQKRDIELRFYKVFSGKGFMDHLPKSRADAFHFIDNAATRDVVVFKKVKDVIIKAGKPVIEKECPITYLQFETGLLQASEIKSTISQQEALEIARRAEIEENVLKEVLLHYSYKGVLLYYPDMPALQDVVFVDPQEVSDLVSSVISTHDCEPSSADLQLSCDRYDTYGLLEESLLDDMLDRCGRLHQKEIILGLLKKFDLAVEVAVTTKFDVEDDSYEVPKRGRVFVVPSMLVYNKMKVYQKQADDVVVLYHFPDRHLPENIFNHLLVKTISWCNKEGHHIQCIYRGIGYFVFGTKSQSFKLQQCQTTSSIKCYLAVHDIQQSTDDQQMMLGQRQGLLAHLKESISEVHHTYIPSARAPIGYVGCPLVHEDNCLPHIRLDDINESENIYCSKNEFQKVPRSAYMLLLSTSVGGSAVARCSNTHLDALLANKLLDQEPTTKQLANIVMPRIAADWRIVAINLEFDQSVIRLIQQRNRDDPENCCLEMLIKWLTEDKGMGPKTWATLLAALKNILQLTSATQQIEADLTQLRVTTKPDNPPDNRSQWWCTML